MKLTASFAVFVLGCAAAPPSTVAPTPTVRSPDPAPAVRSPDPARVAYFRGILAGAGRIPAGASAAALSDELIGWLAATDPEVRDGLAYTLLVQWIYRDHLIDAATLRQFEARLRAMRRAGLDGVRDPDAVFGRSFAALGSAIVIERELAAPAWSAAELAAAVADARWYAEHESDLRGYVAGRGWAHAAAHTADWIEGLARHPQLDRAGAAALLDAVLALALRPHGFNFHHGEDARLAAPIAALLARDLIDDATLVAAIDRLGAAMARRQRVFDERWFASNRNARNLLVTLYTALSLDPRPPTRSAATVRAALERLLRPA